ncbi:MAG TPA: hypothetical protein VK708_10460, partial [Bryobacteraceae bacterium]|nr:hypothetical protein [Bryobacteraceae bacterium]
MCTVLAILLALIALLRLGSLTALALGAIALLGVVIIRLALRLRVQSELLRTMERSQAQQSQHEQLDQRVEEDLRRQKEILQTIFDHIPLMINFVDANDQLKLVNREWERTLGW